MADGPVGVKPARANGPATSVLAPSAPSVSTQAAGPHRDDPSTDLPPTACSNADSRLRLMRWHRLRHSHPPQSRRSRHPPRKPPAANSDPTDGRRVIERVAAVTRQRAAIRWISARSAPPEPDGPCAPASGCGWIACRPADGTGATDPTPLLVADNSASIPLTAPTLVELHRPSNSQPAISAVPKSKHSKLGR